jgi:hypothetical protein
MLRNRDGETEKGRKDRMKDKNKKHLLKKYKD